MTHNPIFCIKTIQDMQMPSVDHMRFGKCQLKLKGRGRKGGGGGGRRKDDDKTSKKERKLTILNNHSSC